jgi:hypothetical protein
VLMSRSKRRQNAQVLPRATARGSAESASGCATLQRRSKSLLLPIQTRGREPSLQRAYYCRATRRRLNKQELIDLKTLESGRWATIFAKVSAKAAAEKERRLRLVAATRVIPEWILLVWDRAKSKHQRPRRRAEEMRFLLSQAGVPPTETSLVIEAIVARLRALSDCITCRRGVKETLNSVLLLESGPMTLARVLADQPVEVGLRPIMPGLKAVPAIVFACGSMKFLEQLLRQVYSELGRMMTANEVGVSGSRKSRAMALPSTLASTMDPTVRTRSRIGRIYSFEPYGVVSRAVVLPGVSPRRQVKPRRTQASQPKLKRALLTFSDQFGLTLYDKEQRNVGRYAARQIEGRGQL